MTGGSHTDFNPPRSRLAHSAAPGALASALGAGFANLHAAQAQHRENWACWTIEQLRRALDLSEAFRRKTHVELQKAVDTIADLRRQLKTAMANSRVR